MEVDQKPRAALRRVTVVVPVYGDWASLRECVISLIAHAPSSDYDVLIVNDVGPDADEIEAGLRALIAGHAHIRYERNPRNLGFVGTCNRTVNELDRSNNDILLLNSDTVVTAGAFDEMRAVLALDDHHGVVCPRSNDATIATIPFYRREHSAPRDPDRARAVFDAVADQLPRYYLAPVAVGFCLLARRDLIRRHGLFDVVFGAGYSEENDFCLRVNAHGVSSLIANHAFVYHVGSSSFGSEQRIALDARNSRVVLERYPHYPSSVVTFIHHDYCAADRFADLLIPSPQDNRTSVLLTVGGPVDDAAEAQQTARALHALLSTTPPSVNVVLGIGEADRTKLGIVVDDVVGENVTIVDPDALETVFDLGVSLSLTTSIQHLETLNRFCLRWAVVNADPSSLRSWATRVAALDAAEVARIAVRYADAFEWRSGLDHAENERLLGATATTTRSTSVEDQPDEVSWLGLLATASAPVDLERLEARHAHVRTIALIAQGAMAREFSREWQALRASRSYRLARRISAMTALPRLLRRDS